MICQRNIRAAGVWIGVSSVALLTAVAQTSGETGEGSGVAIGGSVLEPVPVEALPDDGLIQRITVPDGFEVSVAARGLGNIRMLQVRPGGAIYATRRKEGDVIRLVDQNEDGVFEDFSVVASQPGTHGLAFDGETAFIATVRDVFTAPVRPDGSFGELTRIIDDLPDGGQHPNRTLALGPDGKLYISVGSTCNACDETNPENATLLRAEPDGSGRAIFASGLRNTIGFGWHPETGVLYGADHGIDWLGDEAQPEEFNRIEQGSQYGWPYVYGHSEVNPKGRPPEGFTPESWAAASDEPRLGYTAHAAPMQMIFYTGKAFPEAYQGDAFIVMRGSWNRIPPSGYELTRVRFEEGQPVAWEPFATGFLVQAENGTYGFLSRLAGVAQAADGSLLLADDANGTLFRIRYTGAEGGGVAAARQPAPDTVPPPLIDTLAVERFAVTNAVTVTSPTITQGAIIGIRHGAEGHNASPALAWSGAQEAASYVMLMEDPDAAAPKPFLHWIVYDIPAGITEIPEAQPPGPLLAGVGKAKQGANSRGDTGYFGPRPPVGDGPHAYHFQVFALDIAELGLEPGAGRQEVLAAMVRFQAATKDRRRKNLYTECRWAAVRSRRSVYTTVA